MNKKILLVRTHKTLSAGGPVPPLGLLFIVSAIMKRFGAEYELSILHMGVKGMSIDDIRKRIEEYRPDLVGLSTLTCEADVMHEIAQIIKNANRHTRIMVGGPHATLMKESLLYDGHIDYGIIGEGEATIVELLEALEHQKDLSAVQGVVYRRHDDIICTQPRPYIKNLDDFTISLAAWDSIDLKEYGAYPNWNGACKERYYLPIITSRGCPFRCVFCRSKDIFGRTCRMRSAENVVEEIISLYNKYHIKEIHIFDDVFNFDIERAKRICSLLIETGIKFRIAFPNGMRADMMPEDLLVLLRRAGTYKIQYGIETVTPRLQRMIQKDLDIEAVNDTINRTIKKGIMTGGYFILGFPTETELEMAQTAEFAKNSNLDNAFFFKFTDFEHARNENQRFSIDTGEESFVDLHFYSSHRSPIGVLPSQLNDTLLKAQQEFYLNPRRIIRGLFRSPHKMDFLKNLLQAVTLILQSFLIRKLSTP